VWLWMLLWRGSAGRGNLRTVHGLSIAFLARVERPELFFRHQSKKERRPARVSSLLCRLSDIIGKSEEIADVFWYLSIFSREYNIDFNYYKKELSFLDKVKYTIFKQKLSSKVILDMYKESSLVLDMYKKKLFYNKEINEQKLVEHIETLFKLSSEYCLINNIDISVSLNRNISKLKQRYGDKFSTEKAINRNLDKERDILEGK
jgi:NTP pyrophosphatase (non-canonical NTP hydrolase)